MNKQIKVGAHLVVWKLNLVQMLTPAFRWRAWTLGVEKGTQYARARKISRIFAVDLHDEERRKHATCSVTSQQRRKPA
jgi:hypothetical protein